jgi:hypothetical protein
MISRRSVEASRAYTSPFLFSFSFFTEHGRRSKSAPRWLLQPAVPDETGRIQPTHPIDAELVGCFVRFQETPNAPKPDLARQKLEPVRWISLAVSVSSLCVTHVVLSRALGVEISSAVLFILGCHEMGHFVAARYFQQRSLWPLFVPWVGAVIFMKDPVNDERAKAWIGLAGPIAGVLATAFLHLLAGCWRSPVLLEAAIWGYSMHLFNLIPAGTLDGGHIAGYLARWMWIPGTVGLGAYLWLEGGGPWFFQALLLIIWLSALPSAFGALKRCLGCNTHDASLRPDRFSALGMWVLLGGVVLVCFLGRHFAKEQVLDLYLDALSRNEATREENAPLPLQ